MDQLTVHKTSPSTGPGGVRQQAARLSIPLAEGLIIADGPEGVFDDATPGTESPIVSDLGLGQGVGFITEALEGAAGQRLELGAALIGTVAQASHPRGQRAARKPDSLTRVMSAVRPGTLSLKCAISPVSSCTVT